VLHDWQKERKDSDVYTLLTLHIDDLPKNLAAGFSNM